MTLLVFECEVLFAEHELVCAIAAGPVFGLSRQIRSFRGVVAAE